MKTKAPVVIPGPTKAEIEKKCSSLEDCREGQCGECGVDVLTTESTLTRAQTFADREERSLFVLCPRCWKNLRIQKTEIITAGVMSPETVMIQRCLSSDRKTRKDFDG